MAGMADPPIGELTRRELQRVLSAAGWSNVRAGKELNVSRRQVQRWLDGDPMTTRKLALLAEKSGQPVSLFIGHETAASPNYWARRLQEDAERITDLLAELAEREAADAAADDTLTRLQDDGGGDTDPEDGVAGQARRRKPG